MKYEYFWLLLIIGSWLDFIRSINTNTFTNLWFLTCSSILLKDKCHLHFTYNKASWCFGHVKYQIITLNGESYTFNIVLGQTMKIFIIRSLNNLQVFLFYYAYIYFPAIPFLILVLWPFFIVPGSFILQLAPSDLLWITNAFYKMWQAHVPW